MKASLLSKIFPPSGYRSPLLSYPALLAVMVAELVWMASLGNHEGYDTGSYLDAMDVYAAGQHIDYFRPPVYPLLLLLLRATFSAGNLYVAVNVVQALFMIVSAWYFRKAALRLSGERPRAAFWLTTVYCLLPPMQYQVMLVMTEAPAISGMAILLWWLVRDYPGRMTVKTGVAVSGWLTFLVFLRPMLLCMVPVVMLWAVAMSLRKKSRDRRGLTAIWGGVAICLALIYGYTALMNRAWGVHTFSGVSIANNYCMVCNAGLLHPRHTENVRLQAEMSRIYSEANVVVEKPLYLYTREVPDPSAQLPASEIEAAVNRAIAENPVAIVRHLARRINWMARPAPMTVRTNLPILKTAENTFYPTIGLYLIFLLAYVIWLGRSVWRGNRDMRPWLLWVTCMAVTWAALIGAMNDWGRLMIPSMPFVIMMIYLPMRQWRYQPGEIL